VIGKSKYRSKVRIVNDILKVIVSCGGEAGPTKILYGANLSHDRLTKYLKEMMEKDLIEEVKHGSRVKYKITNKGFLFLKEFKRIKEFLDAFGIPI